jgi:hypothetical protein
LIEELAGELHPRSFAGWCFIYVGSAPQDQGVCAVQNDASGVFEVVAAGVDYREI